MRTAKDLVVAGAAVLALAGGTGVALAQTLHSMTVGLPGGGFAQIQFSGNIAPKVAFLPEPPAAEYRYPASPFTVLDRISAQMDRDMDALMSDVAAALPLVDLPPDTAQHSVVSTMSGDGRFCMRSVEITREAPGARPHVVRHTSGDCRGVGDVRFGVPPLAPRFHKDKARPIEARALRGQQRSGPELLSLAYQPTR